MKPQEILFDLEKCTLLLNVEEKDLHIPDYVQTYAQDKSLQIKKEFHITILGFGAGQKIQRKLSEMSFSERETVSDEIEALSKQSDWGFNPKNEYYHIKKDYTPKDKPKEHRESIIGMVEIPHLGEFINKLSRILNLHLEVPPAHLTLFSTSDIKENILAGIGVGSEEELRKAHPKEIFAPFEKDTMYKVVALPTRAQPDTIIAIFILKQFGEEYFPGISTASYIVLPRIAEGESEQTLAGEGIFLFDVGGGRFDHHTKSIKTTASALIADYLEVKNNPALSRLLQFAERDDFYGKGIISTDPLDRAFGLSGLIGSLNKKFVSDPGKVIELVLPLIDAFYAEEAKRAFEMPQELEDKRKQGKAQEFQVRQKNKILKCIFIDTDNTSMAGFLRSKGGGGFDVVALHLSSGHVNILTRPLQLVDLRSLIVLIRMQEAEARGVVLEGDPESLSTPGAISNVPQWYYDTATNSLLNGGPNPQGVLATSIDPFEFIKLLEIGLSEKLWAPSR
jgi:hypothetical protein